MLRAEEVRARRAVERLTQAEFAKKLSISRQRLNELEQERIVPSKKIEARYDELYKGKRLIQIEFTRGVECPRCYGTSPLELLNDPADELDKIYRCKDCGYYFTVGESWSLHYRP
jgi:DNA-binding XRE family transcriptional regulator